MARTYTAAFVKRNMPIGFHGKFPLGQGGSDRKRWMWPNISSHQPRPDFPDRSGLAGRTKSRTTRVIELLIEPLEGDAATPRLCRAWRSAYCWKISAMQANSAAPGSLTKLGESDPTKLNRRQYKCNDKAHNNVRRVC